MQLSTDIENALVGMVRETARLEIMPKFRNLSGASIQTKSSDIDLVTEADLAAEEQITRLSQQILPGALVIGEEAVSADASVVEGLEQAEIAVIVDPIDGTWNFANGIAAFGVILSVTLRGETVFGLLYDPVVDDWVLARKGSGAWFVAADGSARRVQVAPQRGFSEASGFIPHYLFPKAEQPRLAQGMISARRVVGLCCSCHEFRLLAMGQADFIQSPGTTPWDHAAGVLAVSEAGGFAQMVDGRRYSPSMTQGRLTAATGPALCKEVIEGFGLDQG